MDGGAWWAAVHGVAESRTRLSDFTLTFHFHALEKEMATHSSVLAWRIPGMGEPGGLPSMGSHRVGHDWSDLAAEAWVLGGDFQRPFILTGWILWVFGNCPQRGSSGCRHPLPWSWRGTAWNPLVNLIMPLQLPTPDSLPNSKTLSRNRCVNKEFMKGRSRQKPSLGHKDFLCKGIYEWDCLQTPGVRWPRETQRTQAVERTNGLVFGELGTWQLQVRWDGEGQRACPSTDSLAPPPLDWAAPAWLWTGVTYPSRLWRPWGTAGCSDESSGLDF